MELKESTKQQIVSTLDSILRERFSGEKAYIKPFKDRINFACPYCGDSHAGSHKKRGNIYWKNLKFHCYNGGCPKPHTNITEFFKDHGKSFKNRDELSYVLDYIQANQVVIPSKDYLQIGIFEELKRGSIPLDEIKEKLGLIHPKENPRMEAYLKARFMHYRMEYFLYDPRKDQLYIFNLTPDKKSAIGWQYRNFGKRTDEAKYVSYNMEKMHLAVREKMLEGNPETVIRLNTLSLFFNILLTDFSQMVTVFEGPMDAFLCKNSIALSGIDKPIAMFDDLPHVRYLFDNDRAGRTKMEELLKRKKSVFMWNKVVRDFKVREKVKDFQDLISYCWKFKNDAFKNYDKYFTNSPLDIRSV
jgi:hypothetical protein